MNNASKYAKTYTERYNFHLVPIEPGRKFPLGKDWGNKTLSEPAQAIGFWESHTDYNMGLALGPSRMCSLDIDDADGLAIILDEFGISESELDAYPTIKGKGKRIMFRVPDDMVLPYCKLNWPTKDDHKKKFTVFELRASDDTHQRQDVLPPSIHPDTGEPYAWIVKPPKNLDEWPAPPAWLLAIWSAWDSFKPQFMDACPWVEREVKHAPPPTRTSGSPDGLPDVQGEYNRVNPITSALDRYGYKRKGRRYLSPHSGTGLPGVHVFDSERCWIHHASDPLCSEEKNQPVSSFDLFCYYEHSGDRSAAFKAAAKELGIELKREAPKIPPMPKSEPTPIQQNEEQQPIIDHGDWEFKFLGYNGNKLYVLPRRSEQVVALSAGALSKSALLQIASLEWWEHTFPTKQGVAWDSAINTVLRKSENAGIYDSRKERGRGAWYDNGKPVLHLGNNLVVDGKQMAISEHNSAYIYTKQARMENVFNATPATDEEAGKLADIFNQLNWVKSEHALLALGWSVLAPICGALTWRPHIWITAQRGAGKSWLQSFVMKPVIGEETLIFCQGGTTEAGIRQSLKHDARPVMFDEAESEDVGSARRMQSVLELARQASSDTGAEIVKGTATGDGMTFNVRSMFCMGSINVALKQAADESRFSVLALNKPPKNEGEAQRFAEFERYVEKTLTSEFCASIRARMYHAIPIIRENAKTLSQAVAEVVGSQRLGDQIGALLAGAFAMLQVKRFTLDECRELIAGLDFTEASEVDEYSDENNCLNAILQRQVRVEFEGQGATTRSLGELVEIAKNGIGIGGISSYEANDVLNRHGLKVHEGRLLIANSHAELSKTLRDTPWSSGHRRLLLRIDGAQAGVTTTRFAGTVSRYVSVDI